MSIALTEALQQAQHSFEGGNYPAVVESCNRIVAQFPNFASAYGLLAQAYLEQGQQAEAEQAFARVIAHDPRAAGAYLGLGLIAEERGVLENALAYCQVAWELVPNRDHFREPVVRVAGRRYGADGRLQLTHAALAQLHVNASRLRRAVHEYQTALTELPDRIDLWLGLAETLWRLGQDSDAAEISREFLKDHPDLVQALVILTDIEHRAGNDEEAEQLRTRLRRVDPDGQVTRIMLDLNQQADHVYLLVSDADVPVLDERADVVVTERPQIAPAPDFSYQPSRGDEPAVDIEDLQPMAPEEFEGELAAEPSARPPEPQITQQLPQLPDDAEAGAIAAGLSGFAAVFSDVDESDAPAAQVEASDEVDLEDLAAEFSDLRPIDLDEFGADTEAPTEPGLAALDSLVDEGTVTDAAPEDAPEGSLDDLIAQFDDTADVQSAIVDGDMADILAEFEGIEPMTPDEFGVTEGEQVEAGGGFFAEAKIDFDMRIDDPDAVRIGGAPPSTVDAQPESTAEDEPELTDDELFDQALGPEEDLWGAEKVAVEDAAEPEPFEEAIQAPEAEVADEDVVIEDEAAPEVAFEEAVSEDLAPEDLVTDEAAADEFFTEETTAEAVDTGEAVTDEGVAEEVAAEEYTPDEDVLGVPSGTGYTRLLGELGDEGLAPFDPSAGSDASDFTLHADDVEGAADEASDFARLTEGWDEADLEIESAIPSDSPGADNPTTDELRVLEELGLTPFEVEEAGGTDQLTAFSPFGPIAPAQPEVDEPVELPEEADEVAVTPDEVPETRVLDTQFEAEMAAVTETPQVEDVPEIVEEVPEVEAVPELEDFPLQEAAVEQDDEDLFAGIEPFAIEDFDELGDEEDSFSFGSLPWENNASESALPSDEDLDRMLASEAEGYLEETPDSQATTLFSDEPVELPEEDIEVEPEPPAATIPFGDLEPETGAPEYDFSDPVSEIDASLAVTRELGEASPQADLGADFEQRMSEVEAAAAGHLQQMQESATSPADEAFFGAPTAPIHHEQGAEQPEEPRKTLSPTDLFPHADPEKLVADAQLFDRTREGKEEMVAEGVIRGDRELVDDVVAEVPAPPATQVLDLEEPPQDEPRFEIKTGATKDISTLRASLRAAPNDDELHWWLAEALRERGEPGDAMTEYRWLIRNAPHRHDDVIAALSACAEQGQEAELAHRLLADVYRRRGDSGQARNHATLALAVRRSQR